MIRIPSLGRLAAVTGGLLLAASLSGTAARADVLGKLTCNIAPGAGAIVASMRAVSCTFVPADGPAELYNGQINRLGLDIGDQTSATLVYDVVAAGTPGPEALTGEYIGPGFGVTLGTGGGLNALVGGGHSLTLQPISATTSTGVNVNAGVGELHLVYAGPAAPAMRHHRRHRHHRHH
jgi:hypothetical protein